MRSPRPRRAGCRRPSRICRTSRFAPRRAARSAAPSSPTPGTSWSRPTTRRSSCALLAHIADIPQLKQAFADRLDIHAMTASEMFGVPIKDMPSEVRRRAKAINFGIIYGISAFGLANQLGIAARGGRRLYQEVFRALPRHPRLYGRDQGVLPQATAMSTTLFGAQVPLSRDQGRATPRCAPSTSAPRSTPDAGHCRRHHPPRHDPHGGGAGRSRSSPRRCCCRCMTN